MKKSTAPAQYLATLPAVFQSSTERSHHISRAVKQGIARPLGHGLYTSNLDGDPVAIVQGRLWPIVAMLCPNATVGYRTAFEGRPATIDGRTVVFIVAGYPRRLELPGLVIQQVAGVSPHFDDKPFLGEGLRMASEHRQLLENLVPSRGRGFGRRSVDKDAIEARLLGILKSSPGRDRLNQIRDRARAAAPTLRLEASFEELDQMIGALLATKPAASLRSTRVVAFLDGDGYDQPRLDLLATLKLRLDLLPPVERHADFDQASFRHAAFFDAYFSNFIEGTEFEVQEAKGILLDGQVPKARPEDAHDILGTFELVGSRQTMQHPPTDAASFIATIKQWHAMIMKGRPDKRPGEFKEVGNRAGGYDFVHPHEVLGTLHRGFDLLTGIDDPFSRAVFIMFLLAEVHPFDDGNGRTARAFMNAELISRKRSRIIIPSVYRYEYLGGLGRMSRDRDPSAMIKVMDYAHAFTHALDFTDLERATATLERCNAFRRPEDGIKLQWPAGTEPYDHRIQGYAKD